MNGILRIKKRSQTCVCVWTHDSYLNFLATQNFFEIHPNNQHNRLYVRKILRKKIAVIFQIFSKLLK